MSITDLGAKASARRVLREVFGSRPYPDVTGWDVRWRDPDGVPLKPKAKPDAYEDFNRTMLAAIMRTKP